ncbi:MAG TPA: galactose oxidase, partial [Pedobacter sp.]
MILPGFKIYITLFLLFFTQYLYAQSYGLGFYSHDVVQDKRTALNLNTGNSLKAGDNLSVSFDLSFKPNHAIYFGYILRLISDNNQNIDLVYDNQSNTRQFKIIIGEKLSKIEFNISKEFLYNQWNHITIDIDFKKNKIYLTANGVHYTDANVHLTQGNNYKLLFGANTNKQFQTTDLPPMKLRDIKVSDGGQLVCHWPLNEYSGNIAAELINRNNGTVTNPVWIKAKHSNWQLEKEITVPGLASVAFNAKTEQVYVVTSDSLIVYSDNTIPQIKGYKYENGPQKLVRGNESVFWGDHLYYLYPDQKTIMSYDFKSRKWDLQFKKIFPITNYGHLNKFYSSADTSLYVIGGYGQLIYKDSISKFNVNTRSWQNVKAHGDTFTPRYLGGLGATAKGDTAYILGGYGSASGQQILNPRNLYDMMRFTVKDKKFKKLFSLNVKAEDFVLANSLIINPSTKSYYGLIFPQHKYNSHLQLMVGSLLKPSYQLVGNAIPFLFHDINSFADLYYCPHAAKFLAVTLFKDNEQTRIRIYSLLGPPEALPVSPVVRGRSNFNIWMISFFAAALIVYAFVRSRRKKAIEKEPEEPVSLPHPEVVHFPEPVTAATEISSPVPPERVKNAIYLFGDLQLFTAEGTEITKYFTPLLKELFL